MKCTRRVWQPISSGPPACLCLGRRGFRGSVNVRFVPKATEVLPCRENEAAPLFDHLVGAGDDRRGNFETERLGRFEVYDQFELGRLLHGQVSRFLALQDAVDVSRGAVYWSIGSGP